MKILPDGSVQIVNNRTGEVKVVKPEELASYNPKLVGAYQTALSDQETKQKTIESAAKAVSSGQMTLADLPQDERTDVVSKVSSENGGKVPTSADIQQQAKNKGVATAAKNYLDTYSQLVSSGADLNSEDSKRKLAYAAGKYNSVAGFGEGGKQLTGTELGVLAPTLIKTERQREQNIIERALGNQPSMTKGYLQEDPATAAEKMKLALKETNPELAKQYQSIGQQPANATAPSVQGLVKNAGSNAKDILNGILNIPAQAVELQKKYGSMGQSVISGQGPGRDILRQTLYPAEQAVGEANQVLGEPLKGGDVVGRIGQRAYQKPVTTAMDIAAVLPFLKGKVAPKVVSETAPTEAPNVIQNLVRKGADIASGGGSKEYVARVARSTSNAIPQNQVLMEENILTHPTTTGKITATSKAMENYGSQIGNIYKNNPTPINGSEIGSTLESKLSDAGYNTKDINFIKSYINQQGKFDLNSQDSMISQEKAWTTAKRLEEAPPKMPKNPEAAAGYKQLSTDAARIIREKLSELNPQVKAINAKYSALADYMYNVLKNPQGIGASGGVLNTASKAVKAVGDSALNFMYKAAEPQKLIRDMRFKQGNPQFKK